MPELLRKLSADIPTAELKSEIEELAATADVCLVSERFQNPYNSILDRIAEKRPKSYLFDLGERQLKQEYPVAELKNPSPALRNLLSLAGFTPEELAQVVDDGDHPERTGLTIRINEGLKNKFTAAWQQSAIHPHFEFAADVLRLHIGKGSSFTSILERSEGLRTFVALWTFIAVKSTGEKPILLIDEAESHLHYDAQADLVRVLYEQDDAEQLFYSTHSAGCLPHDLGTAVRVVRPRYDDQKADTGRSEIYRSFWTDPKPGFSPLMFAIGAGAFSMIPTRRVVLAEGPADCILLPSLMREATGLRDLDFQVAPGLANVAPRDVPDLEMEAPKVAFIVDGDDGGRAIAKKLRDGGYSIEQITSLETEFVLEDYVNKAVYAVAVNECVRRSHGLTQELSPNQLPDRARVAFVKSWCAGLGINEPNRVAVAERIVEERGKVALLDPNRKADLLRCHSLIEQILAKRKGA
ncbi:MAG: AAA family ATPase [Flavobacteriales bacterium]